MKVFCTHIFKVLQLQPKRLEEVTIATLNQVLFFVVDSCGSCWLNLFMAESGRGPSPLNNQKHSGIMVEKWRFLVEKDTNLQFVHIFATIQGGRVIDYTTS